MGISLFETLENAEQYAALSRSAAKLKEFCEMIKSLTDASEEMSISELLVEILEKSGYRLSLTDNSDPKNEDRLANVDEFVNTVKQYELENDEPTLSDFLEEIALVSDIDSMNDDEDKVTLMTVHSAKGLEFEKVYLIGLEDGIFPGNQSIYGGESEIEEERRLMYVAITRAKRELTITNAVTRMIFGSTTRNVPSRFLKEIPDEYCTVTESEPTAFSNGFSGGVSAYGRPRYANGGKIPHTSATVGVSSPFGSFAAKKSADTNPQVYVSGQRVSHKTFGEGMILSVSPMGSDTLLEIAFDKVGTKKLMAAYAKLKIL